MKTIKLPKHTLGIPRKEMPQIASKFAQDFLASLKSRGVTVTKIVIDADKIKPTQREFDKDKILKMMDNVTLTTQKPVIISSDNYLLDGHHRWAAAINSPMKMKFTAYKVGLSIELLLVRAHAYDNVGYKDVKEQREHLLAKIYRLCEGGYKPAMYVDDDGLTHHWPDVERWSIDVDMFDSAITTYHHETFDLSVVFGGRMVQLGKSGHWKYNYDDKNFSGEFTSEKEVGVVLADIEENVNKKIKLRLTDEMKDLVDWEVLYFDVLTGEIVLVSSKAEYILEVTVHEIDALLDGRTTRAFVKKIETDVATYAKIEYVNNVGELRDLLQRLGTEHANL